MELVEAREVPATELLFTAIEAFVFATLLLSDFNITLYFTITRYLLQAQDTLLRPNFHAMVSKISQLSSAQVKNDEKHNGFSTGEKALILSLVSRGREGCDFDEIDCNSFHFIHHILPLYELSHSI